MTTSHPVSRFSAPRAGGPMPAATVNHIDARSRRHAFVCIHRPVGLIGDTFMHGDIARAEVIAA